MPDEPSTATAGAGQATASSEAAAQAEPAAAPQVDYAALLDEVPEDVLRAHRRFNGLVGSHAQRLAELDRQRIAQEEYGKAERAKLEELEREAEENPFAFSQKWLKGRAEERAKLELSELRTKAQRELFERIGMSYGALPEWQQLTPDEFARVQKAVTGVNEDELIGRFNVAALDVVADRRAEQRAKERIEAEVQARLQQMQAQHLQRDTVPDMTAPSAANGLSDVQAIRNMSDAEFEKFYSRFRT